MYMVRNPWVECPYFLRLPAFLCVLNAASHISFVHTEGGICSYYTQRVLNEYWKLRDYGELSVRDLRDTVRYPGFIVSHSLSKERPEQLVLRQDRGCLPCFRFTTKQLKDICIQRGIGLPATSKRNKAEFTHRIEEADDESTFAYFADLPSELRVRIYTLHFGELPTLEQPAQPPITKTSKLLRQESLPLFYSTCTFILHAEKAAADEKYEYNDLSYTRKYGKIKGDFFVNTPETLLLKVRHLKVSGWLTSMRNLSPKKDFRIALFDFGRNGTVDSRCLGCPPLQKSYQAYLECMRSRSKGLKLTTADVKTIKELFRRAQKEFWVTDAL